MNRFWPPIDMLSSPFTTSPSESRRSTSVPPMKPAQAVTPICIKSHLGYNLKIADMQAACGLAQLDRLEGFIATRAQELGVPEKAPRELRGIPDPSRTNAEERAFVVRLPHHAARELRLHPAAARK